MISEWAYIKWILNSNILRWPNPNWKKKFFVRVLHSFPNVLSDHRVKWFADFVQEMGLGIERVEGSPTYFIYLLNKHHWDL